MVKNPPANAGETGLLPGSGRSGGQGNGNHSSILAWEIPRTEEPGGLQFKSHRIRYDFVTEQWHVLGSGRVFEATSIQKAFFYIHFMLKKKNNKNLSSQRISDLSGS